MKAIVVVLMALCLFGCAATPPYSIYENTYKDLELGIEISKPVDWHFTSSASTGTNNNTSQQNGQARESLRERSRRPIVIISKMPQRDPQDLLVPTVEVIVGLRENAPDLPPTKMALTIQGLAQQNVDDFKSITSASPTTICGLPAAMTEFSYSQKTSDGSVMYLKETVYIIQRDDVVIGVKMKSPNDGEAQADDAFSQIIKSLKISN